MTSVTVGIPACESARTLARAIGSVRAQTCTDWRLIVSDDASTDETVAIARAAASADPRIEVRCQPTRRGAMNFGDLLNGVETPFFVWLAADDYWAPEFLSRTLALLRARDDAVSALSRAAFVGPGQSGRSPNTGSLDGPWPDRVRRFLAHPGGTRMYGLMRRPALQAAFPPRGVHAYDWALVLGLLAQGPQIEVPEVLLFREETDWLRYPESVDQSGARGLVRQFPALEMSVIALRRGHVPRAAWRDLVALNLRKHEEYVAVCHPAAFGRRLWLYRRLGLPLTTRPDAGADLLHRVADRDPERAPDALAALRKLAPERQQAHGAPPRQIGRAAAPLTAVVTARNAANTLDRLLGHLHRQGAKAILIDHGSTDRTVAIAEAWHHGPVTDILSDPFDGVFDLTAQLRRKADLISALPDGWVIHADADEFLDVPDGERLCDLVARMHDGPTLAIPCRELAFFPEDEDEVHDPARFETTMQMAAPLVEQDPKQRVFRAGTDLTLWMATGGHTVTTDPHLLAPVTLTLRHYLGLSLDDLRAQYLGRVFAHGDRMKRWHTTRAAGGLLIAAPPAGTLARLGGTDAPALTRLPFFVPRPEDAPFRAPAGPIDLWITEAVPGLGDLAHDIVAANFPGLRIGRTATVPSGLPPVLHVICHPATPLAGVESAEARRRVASDWLQGIARARQAALVPGSAYHEVRSEDLPASAPNMVLAVRNLLLGVGSGTPGFVRRGPVLRADCPGPEARAIASGMARDLGYDWTEGP